MSASTPRSTSKVATLMLSLLASALGSHAAHASSPRLLAREVTGVYDMQDGSTVRIDVVGRRVLVESSASEYWTAPNSNLLVSPDGQRSIKLKRDLDGRVDQIEMQITSAR
jgi:hypothetical protein